MAKATSKQICVKSGFHPMALQGRAARDAGAVCLSFNSSASCLLSFSCEQAETRLQLCIQCCRVAANSTRPPYGAAECFHVASGCRAAKHACQSQGPQTKQFFYLIIYICRLTGSQKQCVVVAFELKPLLL